VIMVRRRKANCGRCAVHGSRLNSVTQIVHDSDCAN
jgi:hypothetical protein